MVVLAEERHRLVAVTNGVALVRRQDQVPDRVTLRGRYTLPVLDRVDDGADLAESATAEVGDKEPGMTRHDSLNAVKVLPDRLDGGQHFARVHRHPSSGHREKRRSYGTAPYSPAEKRQVWHVSAKEYQQ